MSCCLPASYGKVFDDREARRNLRSVRKRGLDADASRMVRFIAAQAPVTQTILEIGGGIGALQVELLRAGAAHATNVELSPAYETVAAELLADAGLTARVRRHLGDFTADPEAFAPADVVVMHRVVCCYPDAIRLVRGAAGRARRFLALSYPRDAWWVRVALAVENFLFFRLRRIGFHIYLHPPPILLATAGALGFTPAYHYRGFSWETVVLERGREAS